MNAFLRRTPFASLFRSRFVPLLAIFSAAIPAYSQGPGSLLTRNFNNQRTGANTAETSLTTSNVTASQFGKLFTLSVDDAVFAGVLYVSNVPINGVAHNVVYVATMNNSIFAFDADSLQTPLWYRNFNNGGRPSVNTEVGNACGSYKDFQGDIGIVGTPVIDPATRTLYFVSRTVESGQTFQRLHAVSITTGLERPNSPQVIQASIPGTGEGGTDISFNSVTENQRPALAFSKGVVYIAWASFCDTQPYHGWLIGYDKTSLAQLGVFNATPNGAQAGIWMAGAAPAFDAAGNLYVATGNGTFDGNTAFGESVVKLAPGTLELLDYFTPSNYSTLNKGDYDLGSSGPSFAPGTSLLIAGGKTGTAYLLDSTNLGHEVSGDTQIPQEFQAVDTTVRPTASHHIHNASPWWSSPEGINLYVWGEDDYLHGFRLDPSARLLNTTPFASGSVLPPQGMPGGMLFISANGSKAGTGIVWATASRNGDANHDIVPGNLYAFDAESLALLWSSTGPGDDLFNFSKGSPPAVTNGKVFVGTLSNLVDVYGLKSNGAVTQDLAYLKTATSPNTSCTSDQTPDKALNGTSTGGTNDKWCSNDANPTLNIDLKGMFNVRRFIIDHAGAGGESFSQNTKGFTIEVSTDGVNYSSVLTVTNNNRSISTNDIAPVLARYIRLSITAPTQNADTATRIYEVQIFGSRAS